MNGYFSEYEAYTESEIEEIKCDRIILRCGRTIKFAECIESYTIHNPMATSCIGDKESDDKSFTFYCSPHPIMIKFCRGSDYSETHSFNDFESCINAFGYMFCDY